MGYAQCLLHFGWRVDAEKTAAWLQAKKRDAPPPAKAPKANKATKTRKRKASEDEGSVNSGGSVFSVRDLVESLQGGEAQEHLPCGLTLMTHLGDVYADDMPAVLLVVEQQRGKKAKRARTTKGQQRTTVSFPFVDACGPRDGVNEIDVAAVAADAAAIAAGEFDAVDYPAGAALAKALGGKGSGAVLMCVSYG